MSAIDFAARLAGVPQETIDAVEAAAPHTAALLQTFKDNEDLIVQGKALLDELGPVIAKAQAFYAKLSPLIGPAMTEIDAIMPAAQDVIALVQKQSAVQSTPQQDMRT